ncbi:MAG: HlyD family efflux transporter periplasmic adaptor subunit [Firmicutes bacterium]|nr:HlyD family efflux transporter periplasmic adaptor subunit [Bacillota bacterium]
MAKISAFGAVATIGVLTLAGIAGWYQYQSANFVKSSYAQVAAPAVWITSPVTGTLVKNHVHNGDHVKKGEILGIIHTPSGSTLSITASRSGIMDDWSISVGNSLTAGENLGAIVSLSGARIVAELPGSDLHRVNVGQTVSVSLAANPGQTYNGSIKKISPHTLSIFSPLLPTSTVFSKQTQWVPVIIQLNAPPQLFAGENASVKINV